MNITPQDQIQSTRAHKRQRGLSMIEMISALALTGLVVGGVAMVVGNAARDQQSQIATVQERATITRITQTVRESLQGMNLIGWVDSHKHADYAERWGESPERFTLVYLDPSESAEIGPDGALLDPSPIRAGQMGALIQQVDDPNRPGQKLVQIQVLPNPGAGPTPNLGGALVYTYEDAQCAQNFTGRLYRAHSLTMAYDGAKRQVIESRDLGATSRVAANLVTGMNAAYTNEGISLAIQVADSVSAPQDQKGGEGLQRGQTLSDNISLSHSWTLSGNGCTLRPRPPTPPMPNANVFYTTSGLPAGHEALIRTNRGNVPMASGRGYLQAPRGPLNSTAAELTIASPVTAMNERAALRQFVPLMSETRNPGTLANPLNLTVGNNALHIHAAYAADTGWLNVRASQTGLVRSAVGPLQDPDVIESQGLPASNVVRPGSYGIELNNALTRSGSTVRGLADVNYTTHTGQVNVTSSSFAAPVDSLIVRPTSPAFPPHGTRPPERKTQVNVGTAQFDLIPVVTGWNGRQYGSANSSAGGSYTNCVLGNQKHTIERTFKVPEKYTDGTLTGDEADAKEITDITVEEVGCATITQQGTHILTAELRAMAQHQEATACNGISELGSGLRVITSMNSLPSYRLIKVPVTDPAKRAAGQTETFTLVPSADSGQTYNLSCSWSEASRDTRYEYPPEKKKPTPPPPPPRGETGSTSGVYARIPDGTPMTREEWEALESWQQGYYPNEAAAASRDVRQLLNGEADEMRECQSEQCKAGDGEPEPIVTEQPVDNTNPKPAPEPVTSDPVTPPVTTPVKDPEEPAPPAECKPTPSKPCLN